MFRCFVLLLWAGGLEIHFKSNSDPFDMINGEVLDVDVVFKHEYDQSTYSLFIGCVLNQCIDTTQTPLTPTLTFCVVGVAVASQWLILLLFLRCP